MVIAAYLFGVLTGVAAGMDIYRTLSVSRATLRWLFKEDLLRFNMSKYEEWKQELERRLKP